MQQSEGDKLHASEVVMIFHDPMWRELPNTTDLLIAWVQQLNKGKYYNDWEEEEINKLLKDSFWQNKLRQRLLPFKTITLNDIKRYACPVALTKGG